MQAKIKENDISREQQEFCLELIGVGKSFGGLRANDNVNLQVRQGERVAIIGPNGAGKTTLFNMISGSFYPTDGKILMYGEDVTNLPNYERVYRGLARTYQITTLFHDCSILENVILALMGTNKAKYSLLRPLPKYDQWFEKAEVLIGQVGLLNRKDALIKNLSYGDQRLVELILALASDPKIICLDEPNAGLSVAESRLMIDAIKGLPKDITVLLIEHNMDLVFEVVERLLVLNNGVPVACDTKENIKKNERVQKLYLGDDAEDDDA